MDAEKIALNPLQELAQSLVRKHTEREKAIQHLVAGGADRSTAQILFKQARAQYDLMRRKRGFRFGIIGCCLLVIGFVLTVWLYHAGSSFNLVMYGMTTVGVILLLVGMIDVLGW